MNKKLLPGQDCYAKFQLSPFHGLNHLGSMLQEAIVQPVGGPLSVCSGIKFLPCWQSGPKLGSTSWGGRFVMRVVGRCSDSTASSNVLSRILNQDQSWGKAGNGQIPYSGIMGANWPEVHNSFVSYLGLLRQRMPVDFTGVLIRALCCQRKLCRCLKQQ